MSSWNDPLAGHPRYASVRTISNGPRGCVVLALDRASGEHVAVKLEQRGWDGSRSKYLLREMLIHQALSACRHPHIVELKDVFLTPSHLGTAQEYVPGEDLATFLANTGGRVSEALARFLFQQLVLALSFCHGRGVVCRGLKLANTLLALAPGQLPLLKLGDFSVSKDTARHSAPASQVGAALFVPPEVMHNFSGAAYDGAAADVWAAGIVLFVLLFGRHPFLRPEDAGLPEAGQMLALFTRTAASAFGLLPEEAAAISPGCADMLAAVLQTSPAARATLPQVLAHPWFLAGLPEGAASMNDTILADAAMSGAQPRFAPEALAALVRAGQELQPGVLESRFAPQAGVMAPPVGGITMQQQPLPPAVGADWGAPPPARALGTVGTVGTHHTAGATTAAAAAAALPIVVHGPSDTGAAAAASLGGAALGGLPRLSSAELEALIPLDGLTGDDGGDLFGRFTSMGTLPSLPILPSACLDDLLAPGVNPLLTAPLSTDYGTQQQQVGAAAQVGQGGGAPTASPPAAAAPSPSPPPAAVAAAAAPPPPVTAPLQEPAAQPAVHKAAKRIEVPDDYTPFLVDDDIASGDGEEDGAQDGPPGAVRRGTKRDALLAGVGARASSASLDLRRLSDLLMRGSSAALAEGSAWHRMCSDLGLRAGSGLLGPGQADVAGGRSSGAAQPGQEEGSDAALAGLRAMSITR